MWCSGTLNGEDIRMVGMRNVSGSCEVHLRHVGGELRLLLDVGQLSETLTAGEELAAPAWPRLQKMLRRAAMRVSGTDPWAVVDSHLCVITRRAGYVPLARPVPFRVQAFVAAALNANRAVHGCNETGKVLEPMRINGLSGPYPRSSIVGRASQLHFSIPVALVEPKDAKGSQIAMGKVPRHWVHVAVETFTLLDHTADILAETRSFLGSVPAPCDVGKNKQSDLEGIAISLWRPTEAAHPSPPLLEVSDAIDAPEAVKEATGLQLAEEMLVQRALRARGVHELPHEWDFRKAASGCLLPVRREGRCVAGWALATTGLFEKQACFLSHGSVRTRLSAQRVLDCSTPFEPGCLGGKLEDALQYIFANGVLPEECEPWSEAEGLDAESQTDLKMPTESLFKPSGFQAAFPGTRREEAKCPEPLGTSFQAPPGNATCHRLRARLPTLVERRAAGIWLGAPAGVMAARGERMIQGAIFTYGAVASVVEVFADFLSYSGGLYRRSQMITPHALRGLTAVQIIGWGRQEGDDGGRYWIGEANYGPTWGEQGYFRWVRGEDHLGIERLALYGLVAGLLPLDEDPAGAGVGADRFSALEEKISHIEGLAGQVESQNRWLLAGALVSMLLALAAIGKLARVCICQHIMEDVDESSQPLHKPAE